MFKQNQYDQYVDTHAFRSRIYTLVKTNVRTQRYKSILNMDVSNN